MSISGTNMGRAGLQQYERLAMFEAVLTLRDQRTRGRARFAVASLTVIAAVAFAILYLV